MTEFWIPVEDKNLPDENTVVLLIFIGDELSDSSGEELDFAVRENGCWCYVDGKPLPDYYIPLYYAIIPPCPPCPQKQNRN